MSNAARSYSLEVPLDFINRFGFDHQSHPDAATRMRHRMSFRNERTLYKRNSSLSNQSIISIYAPDSQYVVYSPEEWWSDKWDAEDYGREIDFTKPFFDQYRELQLKVPRIALFNVNPFNSNYCQQAYGNKNCYLCTVVKDCEDSLYVSHSNNLKDCLDCDYVQHSELCYDCLDSDKLYSCIGCDHCHGSHFLWFCFDCIGCNDCIGCWGLRNQKYQIFNVQYSKEEFETIKASINLKSRKEFTKWKNLAVKETRDQHPRREFLVNTESCEGNNLLQAKESINCFDSYHIEACYNCTWTFESHHCAEIYGMGTSEWVYESVGVEKLNFGAFNTFVSDSGYAFYSDLCFYSNNIFGCVGLRKKRNAILNKIYSSDEYEALRERLIAHMKRTGEWGKFFPANCSPFAYNESVANERYPLTEAEARKLGYRWRPKDLKEFQPSSYEVKDQVDEVLDDICNQTLSCKKSKRNYRITQPELVFYKKIGLPAPSICPDERYFERMKRK